MSCTPGAPFLDGLVSSLHPSHRKAAWPKAGPKCSLAELRPHPQPLVPPAPRGLPRLGATGLSSPPVGCAEQIAGPQGSE